MNFSCSRLASSRDDSLAGSFVASVVNAQAGGIHERAYRNRPLSDEHKESNRQKSKLRARIEHVFGFVSQSMKGFYVRYIGRRSRKAGAAIGLINLIYPATAGACSEQMVRLKLLPSRSCGTA